MQKDNFPPKDEFFNIYRTIFVLILFSLLISISYSNTLNASWHLDDFQNILKNDYIHLTSLNMEDILSTLFAKPGAQGKLYRPIPMLSFGLNWLIGQEKTLSYHIVNIIIHIITTIFLYLSIIELIKHSTNKLSNNKIQFAAILSSTLWALHPIQTQAVTYIVQRMASMAGMFYIISIYFYLRSKSSNSRNEFIYFIILTLVFFLLAFGSKENAVLLPFSLVLVELTFFNTFRSIFSTLFPKRVNNYLIIIFILFGFIMLSAIFLWKDPLHLTGGYKIRNFTLHERLLAQPRIIFFYISQLFYPVASRFSIAHHIDISHTLFDPPSTIASIVALIGIILFSLINLRKYKFFCFAILFFIVNHLVESTIIPLEMIFEHRNYIPSLFIFLPISLWIGFNIEKYNKNNRFMYFFLIFFCTVIIVLLGVSTYIRNLAWHSEYTLWQDALEKNKKSARPYHNLSLCFEKRKDYRRIIYLNEIALTLEDSKPLYSKFISLNNIALSYLNLKDYKNAILYFNKCLEIKPNHKIVIGNLAKLYLNIGDIEEAIKKIDFINSKSSYKDSEYLWMKSLTLIYQKNLNKAVQYGKLALQLNPFDDKALLTYGYALIEGGDKKKGTKFINQALNLYPDSMTTKLIALSIYQQIQNVEKSSEIKKYLLDKYPITQIKKQANLMKNNLYFLPLPYDLGLKPCFHIQKHE